MELIRFCNKITPVNWHVTTDPKKYVFLGPGTLNIFFRILDHFIDGWIYAFRAGYMRFYPVSRHKDRSDAKESLEKYGEHFVAESEIWFYPQGCKFSAMIHMLQWCTSLPMLRSTVWSLSGLRLTGHFPNLEQ